MDKTIYKTLGERLRKLRNEKNLSQQKLAESLGMLQQTYAGYETGKRKMDLDTLREIARFHGVSMDYFLCEEGHEEDIKIQTIAAHATTELTDDEAERLIDYVKFLKSQRNK